MYSAAAARGPRNKPSSVQPCSLSLWGAEVISDGAVDPAAPCCVRAVCSCLLSVMVSWRRVNPWWRARSQVWRLAVALSGGAQHSCVEGWLVSNDGRRCSGRVDIWRESSSWFSDVPWQLLVVCLGRRQRGVPQSSIYLSDWSTAKW